MSTREVVDRYYELANLGQWDAWCDQFAPDVLMEEQLAGRVEGRAAVRELMRGFPSTFARFRNDPVHIVVDGDGERAAVVSHISATTVGRAEVEADVVNYFHVVDGRIVYFANFHDTVPFRVLDQAA